ELAERGLKNSTALHFAAISNSGLIRNSAKFNLIHSTILQVNFFSLTLKTLGQICKLQPTRIIPRKPSGNPQTESGLFSQAGYIHRPTFRLRGALPFHARSFCCARVAFTDPDFVVSPAHALPARL